MRIKYAEQIIWCFSDPILILNNTLQVEYGNVALKDMLGTSFEEFIAKVFEPFITTKEQVEGTGLG